MNARHLSAYILSIIEQHNHLRSIGMKPWLVVALEETADLFFFDTLVEAEKFVDGNEEEMVLEIRGWDEETTAYDESIYDAIKDCQPDYDTVEQCMMPDEAKLVTVYEQIRPKVHVELRKIRKEDCWRPSDMASRWLELNG